MTNKATVQQNWKERHHVLSCQRRQCKQQRGATSPWIVHPSAQTQRVPVHLPPVFAVCSSQLCMWANINPNNCWWLIRKTSLDRERKHLGECICSQTTGMKAMRATRAKDLSLDALKPKQNSLCLERERDQERCASGCLPPSRRIKPRGTRSGDRRNVGRTPGERMVWFCARLHECGAGK